MINPFKIRKYAALILAGFLPTICFYIGLVFYGLMYSLGTMGLGLLLAVVLGNVLLKTPFSMMLEGKGILVLNMDSTGIIKPFVVGLDAPYVKGKAGRREITDVWDRSTVYNLSAPHKNKGKATPGEKGGVKFTLDEENYNRGRFQLFHFPTLIYNEQMHTFLTKDFFSNMEKQTFAEHGVLYLNRKMEELTSAVRDFGRHVVELTKPIRSIFQSKWTWIVIFIMLVIFGILFAPAIINSFGGQTDSIGQAVQTATSTVIPR